MKELKTLELDGNIYDSFRDQVARKNVPRIGENGNWWIGDTDTGVSAGGSGGGGEMVKLGDIIVSGVYEYEMVSATNGVVTIDISSDNYSFLTSGDIIRVITIPKDITVKDTPKLYQLAVNNAELGTFDMWNRDGSAKVTDSIDVTKYKLSSCNVSKIVMENIPDMDNYKVRVTSNAINTNGLRSFFGCSMTGLSFDACVIINSTGGAIIEIEAIKLPYDENYFYKKTSVLWGNHYVGSGKDTFESFEIKPAGVGENKLKNGEIKFIQQWMLFTNGMRFELWGANDA